MLSSRTISLIFGTVGVAGIAPSQSFIKLIEQDIPATEILFIRGVLVTLGLLIAFAFSGRLHREYLLIHHPWFFAINGILFAVGATCFFQAIYLLDLAFITAIVMSSPLITVILARVFLKERVTRYQLAGIFIAFSGIVICVMPQFSEGSSVVVLGVVLAGIRLLATSVSTIVKRHVSQLETLEAFMLATTAISIGFSVIGIFFQQWIIPNTHSMMMLLWFCAVQLLITWCGAVALRNLTTPIFSALGNLQLPAAVLAGWMIFGEVPHWLFYPGSAVLLLGVYIVTHTRQSHVKGDAGQMPKVS